MSRWRSFLNGVATLNLWGTPVKRPPQPPIADVLAKDAANVHADFMRAFTRQMQTVEMIDPYKAAERSRGRLLEVDEVPADLVQAIDAVLDLLASKNQDVEIVRWYHDMPIWLIKEPDKVMQINLELSAGRLSINWVERPRIRWVPRPDDPEDAGSGGVW